MNKGKIVQVMGPVVDVVFEDGDLPEMCIRDRSCGAKSEDCGTTGTGGNHLYAERCVCGQKIRNRWSCI